MKILKKHIRQLATKHKIEVFPPLHRDGRASSFRINRRIYIPEIKSEKAYASAMHEIGHIMTFQKSKFCRGRITRFRLREEFEATMWAKKHALIWSETMRSWLRDCFNSYVKQWEMKWGCTLIPRLKSLALKI